MIVIIGSYNKLVKSKIVINLIHSTESLNSIRDSDHQFFIICVSINQSRRLPFSAVTTIEATKTTASVEILSGISKLHLKLLAKF